MPKHDTDDLMRSHVPASGPFDPPQEIATPGPPPFAFEQLSPEQLALLQQRQRSRAIVMALLLGLFVILVFAIAIAKIKAGHA